MKREMLWARVDASIAKAVRQLSDAKGISVSEYMRQLVIADLDSRSVFNTRLTENHK